MRYAAILLVAACGPGTILGTEDLPRDGGGVAAAPDAPLPRLDAGPMPTAENGGTVYLEDCGYAVTTRRGATAPWFPPAGALGPDPTPRHVHLGIAGDPARTIAVLWRTVDEKTFATSVRYGERSVDEARADGFTFVYRSGTDAASPRLRVHETHLCGLRPDTVYRYQVGADGAWSPEHTFRTAPDVAADASAQVTLVMLGDSRGGQTTWGSLIAAADALVAPDLILFTGDAVASGVGQSEWEAFYDRAAEVLARVPILFTNGNHENNAVNFYSQAAMPDNEQWYSLDYGPAHIAVLNDSPADVATIAGEQRGFLDDDMAAHAAAPWRLLMHHRSMFSSASVHGSNLSLRAAWEPVVDARGVDLVLSGHDHDYERTRPLRGAAVAAGGTTYLVVGGAGAELYANGTSTFTAYSERRYSWASLSIRRGQVDGRAYRDDGSMMDSFALSK